MSLSLDTAQGLLSTMPLSPDGVDREVIADVFGEIANAIGGRIAASFAGDEFAFDLTVPQVEFEAGVSKKGNASFYQTDFGVLVFRVTVVVGQNSSLKKGA